MRAVLMAAAPLPYDPQSAYSSGCFTGLGCTGGKAYRGRPLRAGHSSGRCPASAMGQISEAEGGMTSAMRGMERARLASRWIERSDWPDLRAVSFVNATANLALASALPFPCFAFEARAPTAFAGPCIRS